MAFNLVDDYPQFPRSNQTCSACGAGRRVLDGGRNERIVDLGFPVDVVRNDNPTGQTTYAYLCESCAVEIGRLLGMATSEETVDLVDHLAEARRELADRKDRVAVLENLVDALRRADSQPDATANPSAPANQAPQARETADTHAHEDPPHLEGNNLQGAALNPEINPDGTTRPDLHRDDATDAATKDGDTTGEPQGTKGEGKAFNDGEGAARGRRRRA